MNYRPVTPLELVVMYPPSMSSEISIVREREILDPAQVEQLRSLKRPDGTSLLSEVVNVFLLETPQRLAELKALLPSRQSTAIAAIAHKIAGSAAGVGAVEVRKRAQALEKTAKMLELDELPDFFQRLENAWQELTPDLLKLI